VTDRIAPALTAEEWARQYIVVGDRGTWVSGDGAEWLGYDDTERVVWKDRIPAVIALANAALPDSDPRKITRAMVDAMREVARAAEAQHDQSHEFADYEAAQRWTRWADALSSYLPPEGP
jgi:hypothetical protein